MTTTSAERCLGRAGKLRRVRVIVNPKSGVRWTFDAIRRALDRYWEARSLDLTYQFSQSAADSVAKAKRAAAAGVDLVLVVGGDGSFNAIGAALLDTPVCLGIIPTGSGNGLARHFGIPLDPAEAVKSLAQAEVTRIDVGVVDRRPFFVTCSMAWDAAIVRTFNKSPVRGIVPYIFAGVYEFFDYRPQEMRVALDSGEVLTIPDPLVFTIANLTQYGGGAAVAPQARPDDGLLELVVARRRDAPYLLAKLGLLIKGRLEQVPWILSRRFKKLVVRRAHPAPIQIDGELAPAPAEIEVWVRPKALKLLVPPTGRKKPTPQ